MADNLGASLDTVSYSSIWADEIIDTHQHCHEQAQLVLCLSGTVACEVLDTHWIVQTHCALWIPAKMTHRSQASVNSNFCTLFFHTVLPSLPNKCCTFLLSPMLREMILELSIRTAVSGDDKKQLLIQILLDELCHQPIEQTCFPLPSDLRLRKVAHALIEAPNDRKTMKQWAADIGMSERSLSRHIFNEMGMSFSVWRRQLRLLVALKALSQGIPVQRISDDLGYESVAAFISMFKKALGTSPGKYFPKVPKV